LDERGVGCPEAYGHTQKLFFGVRRQSALKLLGIPRNVLVRGQAALKLCNVGGIFSQLLSNANPFPTFLWMYCLVHPNLKDCTQKLYLDEVFKESTLVVGCKMTKNVDGMDVNVGWLVTLLRKTKKKSYK
jgi:hypothetical protein